MQRKTPALFALLVLAGCQTVLPPDEPPPFDQVSVRVWPPDAEDLVVSQSAAWRSRQRATVVVTAERDRADIWVLPPADVRGLNAPVPEPLTARGTAFDWVGLLPLYREQLGRADGKPVALPLTGEAPVCFYRADLYAEHAPGYAAWRAGRKLPPQPLRGPLTWAEFRDQGAFFAEALKRPSLPPMPKSVEGLDRLYYQIAAPYARRAVRADEEEGPDHVDEVFYFHYDRRTESPRLTTPGFVYALTLLRELRALSGSDERQAVLGIVEAGELARLQRDPGLKDRLAITSVPGAEQYWDAVGRHRAAGGPVNAVPYVGGVGRMAGVSPTAANAAAAWDLLAELAGPMRAGQTALEPRWGGGPTRAAGLLRDRWDGFGLDGPRTQALREVVGRATLQHGLKNPVLVLRTDDHAVRRLALHRALTSDAGSPAEALQRAAGEWAALDAKKGTQRAMADYRRSLGLTD